MALPLPAALVALPWLLLTHPTSPPDAMKGASPHTPASVESPHRNAEEPTQGVRRGIQISTPHIVSKASMSAEPKHVIRNHGISDARARRQPTASCDVETSFPQVPSIPRNAEIENILILGDSHAMGYFGRVLHNRLRKKFDANVTLVGACGKSEPGFIHGSYTRCGVLIRTKRNRTRYPLGCRQNPCKEKHGPNCSKQQCRPKKLTTYLRSLKPDVVILQLGANSTWMGTAENGWPKVRAHIRTVVNQLKATGTRCVWVTAPDTMIRKQETQDKFAALYEDELEGHCEVFNSRPSHRPYMHYSKIVRELKLQPSEHDRMHYWWFGKRGRRIQTKWATDVIAFTAERFGPNARILRPKPIGLKQLTIQRSAAPLLPHRQERREYTKRTSGFTHSRMNTRRHRERERRRTRDNKTAAHESRDDSAYYQP